MTGLARALTHLLCLFTGWLCCMWWNGLLVRADTAAAQTQSTGERFIVADRAIGTATQSLDATRERVRTVIKEVPTYVPSTCPPGVGLVSEPVAASLRSALAQAASATAPASTDVRAPRD